MVGSGRGRRPTRRRRRRRRRAAGHGRGTLPHGMSCSQRPPRRRRRFSPPPSRPRCAAFATGGTRLRAHERATPLRTSSSANVWCVRSCVFWIAQMAEEEQRWEQPALPAAVAPAPAPQPPWQQPPSMVAPAAAAEPLEAAVKPCNRKTLHARCCSLDLLGVHCIFFFGSQCSSWCVSRVPLLQWWAATKEMACR